MRAFVDANLIIYLNTLREPEAKGKYRSFYEEMLNEHRCFTNAQVLDEALFISKRKYGFDYADTIKMIDEQVLPFVEVLPITIKEYRKMTELLVEGGIKPSDSTHLSSMLLNDIRLLISEDSGFDSFKNIQRVWLKVE